MALFQGVRISNPSLYLWKPANFGLILPNIDIQSLAIQAKTGMHLLLSCCFLPVTWRTHRLPNPESFTLTSVPAFSTTPAGGCGGPAAWRSAAAQCPARMASGGGEAGQSKPSPFSPLLLLPGIVLELELQRHTKRSLEVHHSVPGLGHCAEEEEEEEWHK